MSNPSPATPVQSHATGLNEDACNLARGRWEQDPVATLEHLRELVCRALCLTSDVYQLAKAAPGLLLLDVIDDTDDTLVDTLLDVIDEARAIWFATRAAHHVEGVADGPIYLDQPGDQPGERVCGTCAHDLALAVAVVTAGYIGRNLPAADYVASWTWRIDPFANVGQCFSNLRVAVRCESRRAIDQVVPRREPERAVEPPSPPAASTAAELDVVMTAVVVGAAKPLDTPAKKVSWTVDEANPVVARWLNRNAPANPKAVSLSRINHDTGISEPTIWRTPAWKGFEADRKNERPFKEIQLTDGMLAVLPASETETPEELAELLDIAREVREARKEEREQAARERSRR